MSRTALGPALFTKEQRRFPSPPATKISANDLTILTPDPIQKLARALTDAQLHAMFQDKKGQRMVVAYHILRYYLKDDYDIFGFLRAINNRLCADILNEDYENECIKILIGMASCSDAMKEKLPDIIKSFNAEQAAKLYDQYTNQALINEHLITLIKQDKFALLAEAYHALRCTTNPTPEEATLLTCLTSDTVSAALEPLLTQKGPLTVEGILKAHKERSHIEILAGRHFVLSIAALAETAIRLRQAQIQCVCCQKLQHAADLTQYAAGLLNQAQAAVKAALNDAHPIPDILKKSQDINEQNIAITIEKLAPWIDNLCSFTQEKLKATQQCDDFYAHYAEVMLLEYETRIIEHNINHNLAGNKDAILHEIKKIITLLDKQTQLAERCIAKHPGMAHALRSRATDNRVYFLREIVKLDDALLSQLDNPEWEAFARMNPAELLGLRIEQYNQSIADLKYAVDNRKFYHAIEANGLPFAGPDPKTEEIISFGFKASHLSGADADDLGDVLAKHQERQASRLKQLQRLTAPRLSPRCR